MPAPEAAKPAPEAMPSEAEAEVSPAAAAPSAPSAAAPSSAGKTSPLAAATALNAAAAFAAPTPSARTVSAARMTASALSADQDPLATLVLPSLNIGRPSTTTPAANKPKTAFLHTPSDQGSAGTGAGVGSGFKRDGIGGKTKGGGAKGSLSASKSDAKQKSLFGFFTKTPAPSAADRPRTVQTPTTGEF